MKNPQTSIQTISREDISQVAEFFSIVHHIPGRIRIRVNIAKIPAIKKWAQSTNLRTFLPNDNADENLIIALLKSIKAVKNIKVNALIGSATIEYDKNLFAPNLWENWVKKENLTEIESCLNQMLQNLDSGGK